MLWETICGAGDSVDPGQLQVNQLHWPISIPLTLQKIF